MGLFSRDKPKIKIQTAKKDSFSGWLKCTYCSELIHFHELEKNMQCCPKCNYHYKMDVPSRIAHLLDEDSFVPLFEDIFPEDPLDFVDTLPYKERLAQATEKTGAAEAVCVGKGTLDGIFVALGVMDFQFMGGSMGSVVGEKITRLVEYAKECKLPLILVCSSGGARMQESIFSLMQMAKTSAALAKLSEACLPYISLLTNPTSGGVSASFASLADVILAEPKALICFAGPRVIEQTIGERLPEDAQKAEFLLEHGMIDSIIERKDQKKKIASMLRHLHITAKI